RKTTLSADFLSQRASDGVSTTAIEQHSGDTHEKDRGKNPFFGLLYLTEQGFGEIAEGVTNTGKEYAPHNNAEQIEDEEALRRYRAHPNRDWPDSPQAIEKAKRENHQQVVTV